MGIYTLSYVWKYRKIYWINKLINYKIKNINKVIKLIIRINNKEGKNIGKCDLYQQDIGIWYINKKQNINNIYGDIIQTKNGFTDVLDIDLDII